MGGDIIAEIVVVFPKKDNAIMIRNLLVKNGYNVLAVCTSGSQALNACEGLDSAIVITGYKLPDMMYYHIKESLDERFEVLLIASMDRISECEENGIITIAFPLKVRELINTVDMLLHNMAEKRKKRRGEAKNKPRSKEDTEIINQAKEVLMDINNFTENEAYRYIQKTSMDSGNNMVETAKMILTIMFRE